MGYKTSIRLGLAFAAALTAVILLYAQHEYDWNRQSTALDAPLHMSAGHPATPSFVLQANVPYAIEISETDDAENAKAGAAALTWTMRASNGHVLQKGASRVDCCFAILGTVQVPAATRADVVFTSDGSASIMRDLSPRITVRRADPNESELALALKVFFWAGVLGLITLAFLVAGWRQYRAQKMLDHAIAYDAVHETIEQRDRAPS